MTRICNNCTKEYETSSAKSKYCSEACKQAAKRNRTVSPTVSRHDKSTESDTMNDTIDFKHTKTDQLFQDDAIARKLGPDWLAFTNTVRSPDCIRCKKKFKTRLPLLRYCSPTCRTKDLKGENR